VLALQWPELKGFIQLVTSSKGMVYFDALEACKFYKIDMSDYQVILDRWRTFLKYMPFDSEHQVLEGSLWIPIVCVVSFLEDFGWERDQVGQGGLPHVTNKRKEGLVRAMLESQFAEAKYALAEDRSAWSSQLWS
tara:strand:+ start:2712 stop:3116 length:405 start_codon:yes stop_codon:yes gene_type:complete